MFKSARWKSEKNKFKAVFKLHFHASQLEQVGGDTLMISLIPADVGKPTVKSEKAAIRDGSCFWENPVYETVKFFQEPKSGKINEKIYYFVILSGSSNAGLVGEVLLDFSSYAESNKSSSVSLPFKNSKRDGILHVSIQRLPENVDQRDTEENENANINSSNEILKAKLRNVDPDDGPACSESDLTMSSSESSSGLNTPIQILYPREVVSEEKSQEASEIEIEKLKNELVALCRIVEVSELELQSLRKQIAKERKRGQDLSGEIVILKEERDDLEIQKEHLSIDYEILKQEKNELLYRLEQSQVLEKLKMQYECSLPYASVSELENQIENLETEFKKQSNEFLESLATVTKLETDVEDLEDEMEKRARGFEADLEILIGAKVDQEQRAIKAETALRKMQWQNQNTAARIQDELGRISVEVAFTLEENERMTTEASELLLQKNYLEELLWKEKQEIQLVKDRYEAKLADMESEIENGKKNGEETHRVLSHEILMFRAEIEMLKTQNNILLDEVELRETSKDELQKMKTSMEENEMLQKRGNMEKNDLEGMIALLRKDAEKLTEELNSLRSSKNEQELIRENLQLELDILKSKQFKYDFEKEELKNQVCGLKADLNKAKAAFSNLEQQLNDNETHCSVAKDLECIALNGSLNEDVENRSMMPMIGSCDEVSLLKEMEASIFSSLDECYLDELLKEMELLRVKNTSMEGELKQIQERYSEISLKFAEVEGERQRLLMTRNRKNSKKC